MERATRSRVEVKAVMAGVRMVAGRIRMSESILEARDLVSISQAAYRTGTSTEVCAICSAPEAVAHQLEGQLLVRRRWEV